MGREQPCFARDIASRVPDSGLPDVACFREVTASRGWAAGFAVGHRRPAGASATRETWTLGACRRKGLGPYSLDQQLLPPLPPDLTRLVAGRRLGAVRQRRGGRAGPAAVSPGDGEAKRLTEGRLPTVSGGLLCGSGRHRSFGLAKILRRHRRRFPPDRPLPNQRFLRYWGRLDEARRSCRATPTRPWRAAARARRLVTSFGRTTAARLRDPPSPASGTRATRSSCPRRSG